jgi:HD-GYP domain-containing protein (c-di-GMP phosphodiesterase class II)
MKSLVNSEEAYEDLLGQWSDLESGLAVLLAHPQSAQEFEARIRQYGRWMQDLSWRNADLALYLLFQLASYSPVGYSAAHALVCGVLCHLLAEDFDLPGEEHACLVHAAFTMNVAMTALQNQLAAQRLKPGPEQRALINDHAARGVALLQDMGIRDPLWLEIVRGHHPVLQRETIAGLSKRSRYLSHILGMVDRYAAMISPRQSRDARSVKESARNVLENSTEYDNPVGQALVRVIGMYPPGTYVQLDDKRIAVVMRKGQLANMPDVAVVLDKAGEPIRPPQLHPTATGRPYIIDALPASVTRERLNHHLILQLGAQTT